MPWNETTKTEYTRPRDRFESDLTDEEWNLVKPCLPPPAKRGRPRKTDLREVSDAIQFMLATGCQWRAIRHCFPPAATVQQYFYAWSRNGIVDRMTDKLRALGRKLAGRAETPTAAAINTQSAETTESGVNAKVKFPKSAEAEFPTFWFFGDEPVQSSVRVSLLGRPRFFGGGGGVMGALVRTCSGMRSACFPGL